MLKDKISKLTEGLLDYTAVAPAGDILDCTTGIHVVSDRIICYQSTDGKAQQITYTNKDLLEKLSMGNVEERWMKTLDGQDMLTIIIYPPHFDPNKKYPALLYCKGGPQGPLSQNFHYRWNYQIMAANGYIIVAPNRRGVSGFGQAWQEQISGDYHGKSMQDYLAAIDEMAKEPFVDRKLVLWAQVPEGRLCIIWPGTIMGGLKHLSRTMGYSTKKLNTWKQKKCGLKTGIKAVHSGIKTTKSYRMFMLIHLINL